VRALTGIDPDRLEEERRRGMTIDLGFAHLDLPSGRRVGIVDVPGHARFLHNMLAGVHGMDAVLLVVAADEGVMPQTREHLDILQLLGVSHLLVALTKVDLVEAGMARLARDDVLAELRRREIAAEVVPTSAPAGEGLEELRAGITRMLAETPARDRGLPRLPVDRTFVMTGFGCVVTGSLVDGELRVGQELELLPAARDRPLRPRVRGLQQHGRAVETAAAGSRVAANLQGIDATDVERGQVLAPPGTLRAGDRLDARVRVLPCAPALRHNDEVAVHTGTAQVMARVVALEVAAIEPGGQAFVQLRLRRPLAVRDGDRLVLRRRSPAETLGGGAVVDAAPPPRRRSQAGAVASLGRRLTAEGRVREELAKARDGAEPDALAAALALPRAELEAALQILVRAGAAVRVGERLYAAERWLEVEGAAAAALEEFHRANPLRLGMPRESLGARLGLRGRGLAEAVSAMAARGAVVEPVGGGASAALVAMPGHAPRLSAAEREAVARALAALGAEPTSPPAASELARSGLGDSLRAHLEETGQVVRVAPDLLMLPSALEELRSRLGAALADRPAGATVAEIRDLLGSSRRTVVPLLEHLDATRFTIREGDRHRLREAPATPARGAR
jgi:selenocysteine-specific elongation factor